MNESLEEKYAKIKQAVLTYQSTDPLEIVKGVMHQDFISMHGLEHHFLDGASFLVAYKNAGGSLVLEASLDELARRSMKMPGAMCGYWGVCGACAFLGASLAIINHTGPLTSSEFYKDNMEFISQV